MNYRMANTKIKLTQGLFLIGLTLNLGIAFSDSVFSQIDSDGSGAIDQEEFRSHMVDTFFHADIDRDGMLAGDELAVLNQSRLDDSDKNSDGALNLREFLNSTGTDFYSSDANGDNLLGKDEL